MQQLTAETPLPPQQVVLTVTNNKVQLINIICEQLIKTFIEQYEDDTVSNRLVLTGSASIPKEVKNVEL